MRLNRCTQTGSKERTKIPKETKEKLILYCRNECCLCDKKVSGMYESNIHHINNNPTDNKFENLLLLCPNCHAAVTRGDYKVNQLQIFRDAKIEKLGIKEFVENKQNPEISFKDRFLLKIN